MLAERSTQPPRMGDVLRLPTCRQTVESHPALFFSCTKLFSLPGGEPTSVSGQELTVTERCFWVATALRLFGRKSGWMAGVDL